jgi:ABC-type spermidine/putrescine transport system permease subunit I
MIGNAVATQFGMLSNWPLGAAMVFSTILVIVLALAAVLAVRRGVRLVRA